MAVSTYQDGLELKQTVSTPYLQAEQAKVANQGKPGYDVFGNPVSGTPKAGGGAYANTLENTNAPTIQPTVLSGATFREDTKPQLNSRLNALSPNKPQYQGVDGNQYYSGEIDPVTGGAVQVQAPVGAQPNGQGGWEYNGEVYGGAPTLIEDPQQNALLTSMLQNTDAQTKALIKSVTDQFAIRKAQQADINKRAEAGTEQALLMAGSSRYAPISSTGIQQAQESFGLQQIASLDAQEQALIAEAKNAQYTKNYEAMSKALDRAEAVRKEKQEAATKLSDKLAEENKKIREKQIQASRDSAVVDLYAQGITDPTEILDYLNFDDKGNQIGDFTFKEVNDIIKEASPAGLDDLVKTLRTNGAPQDVISKVLTSRNMSEAYTAAGNYAAGGTGIIGEYNYYKAQAEAAGQVPLTFDEYQTRDANRKARIAAAGVATGTDMTPKQVTIFNSLVDKQNKSPLVAANDRAVILKDVTDAVAKDPTNASLQVSFIYSMIQALDTYQSAVREGEISLISGTQGLGEKLANLPSKIQKGNPLNASKVKEYVATSKLITDSINAAAQKKKDAFAAQAKIAGVGDAFDEYNAATGGSTSDDLMQTEEQAKNSVLSVAKSNPEANAAIKPLLAEGISYQDIIAQFPELFPQ